MFYTCIEDFRFEAAIMSVLEHPNIMKCLGANEKDREPFIVMPLCGMVELDYNFLRDSHQVTGTEVGTINDLLRLKAKCLTLSSKLNIAIQLAKVRFDGMGV